MYKYFRNRSEIKGIEPESLWYFDDPFLFLVDEDAHIMVPFDRYRDVFYEVSKPEDLREPEE